MSRLPVIILTAGFALALAWQAQAREVRKAVRFERGADSAAIQGAVVRGDRDVYELAASAGQEMEVAVAAFEDNAALVVRAPGGKALPGAGDGQDAASWKGRLPASGVYRIEVGPTRGNAEYSLSVSIRSPGARERP